VRRSGAVRVGDMTDRGLRRTWPTPWVAMEHDLDDVHTQAQTAPEVPAEWFLEPDRAHGIHGAGHIRRVHTDD
jgi:hypothetical protein